MKTTILTVSKKKTLKLHIKKTKTKNVYFYLFKSLLIWMVLMFYFEDLYGRCICICN